MSDTPTPVSNEENEAAKRHALCARHIWDDHIAYVENLRQRESDYRATLPSSPDAASLQAIRLLSPDGDEMPPCLERAGNMAVLLEIALQSNSDADLAHGREALSWAAEQLTADLSEMRDLLSRALDVLRNPLDLARVKGRAAA